MKFRYEGRSTDNSMMESFFCILKSEMFYGYENTFKSLNQWEQAIVDYIDYYNNKRMKEKLKGFSPVKYRTKSFTCHFLDFLTPDLTNFLDCLASSLTQI